MIVLIMLFAITDKIANAYDCATHVIRHVLNFMVGPTPFEVKFKDVLLEEVTFILNDSDHQYMGRVDKPEFSTFTITKESCN